MTSESASLNQRNVIIGFYLSIWLFIVFCCDNHRADCRHLLYGETVLHFSCCRSLSVGRTLCWPLQRRSSTADGRVNNLHWTFTKHLLQQQSCRWTLDDSLDLVNYITTSRACSLHSTLGNNTETCYQQTFPFRGEY